MLASSHLVDLSSAVQAAQNAAGHLRCNDDAINHKIDAITNHLNFVQAYYPVLAEALSLKSDSAATSRNIKSEDRREAKSSAQ